MFRRAPDAQSMPSVFPTFLQPPLSFRRKSRQPSADSVTSAFSVVSLTSKTTISTQSSNPFSRCSTPVPVPVQEQEILEPTDKYLRAHKSHIQCAKCSTDLALTSQIISKGFTGRHGRAFLVENVPVRGYEGSLRECLELPNTCLGRPVPRSLVTGQHTVSDVLCAICKTLLGWKYVAASEASQKYKVGKFILETKRIRVGVNWEDSDVEEADQWEELGAVPMHEVRKMADLYEGNAKPASSRPRREERIEFDSQDEDECEDLFAGVWSPVLARKRQQRRKEREGRRTQKDVVAFSLDSSGESLASISRDSSQNGNRRP